MSTFGVNEAKPAYTISSETWAPLLHPPTTLDVTALNEQSMSFYDIYGRTVADHRRERGVPELKDAVDAFRVTVTISPADHLLVPMRPSIGEAAKAAARGQGADESMAEAAEAQALESFDALVDVMCEHGSFEYTLDRYLNMLPELGNAKGQRVLYLGNRDRDEEEGAEVHDLKRLLVGLVTKGCVVDKNNVWVLYHPGGQPQQLTEHHGITHGVSHGGRISLAWNANLDDLLQATTSERSRALSLPPMGEGPNLGGEDEEEPPQESTPCGQEGTTGKVLDLPVETLDKLKMLWYDQPGTFKGNPTTYDPEQPVWWVLTVFDPSTIEWGGKEVEDAPPVQPDVNTFREWAENTEMWSALDLITIPFPEQTAEDTRAGRETFERNPVEIKKAADLRLYADSILTAACSELESEERESALGLLHNYAEYCEEGKTNTKNVGLCTPLNWQSVEEGRISKDAFTLYATMAEAFKERSPKDAWEWLHDKNFITEKQLRILERRGYLHQRLRVLDDSVRPWTDYRPKGVETDPEEDGCGLFTRPVTAITLTAHYLASNFPREELVRGFLKGVNKVLEMPENSPARQSLVGLAQAQGLAEVSAEAVASLLAMGFIGGFLTAVKPQFLDKMRYADMDDTDKANLDKYLDKFQALAVNPMLDRDTLVVAVKELNDDFREVRFPSLRGKLGQAIDTEVVRGLQFYPPLIGIESAKGAPFMPYRVGHHHLTFMISEHYRLRE